MEDGENLVSTIEEPLGVEETVQQELMTGKYHPKAVRRTYIPKGNGEQRPLGIPIIKDRVIQMSVKIVIEALFEVDFKECSYGFRPKRSAHQALDRIRKDTKKRGWWIVDTDIKGYFNNINHEKLMLMAKQRISDRRILKMIWKWLKAGVMENGNLGVLKEDHCYLEENLGMVGITLFYHR